LGGEAIGLIERCAVAGLTQKPAVTLLGSFVFAAVIRRPLDDLFMPLPLADSRFLTCRDSLCNSDPFVVVHFGLLLFHEPLPHPMGTLMSHLHLGVAALIVGHVRHRRALGPKSLGLHRFLQHNASTTPAKVRNSSRRKLGS
jgi:hypothetical protein